MPPRTDLPAANVTSSDNQMTSSSSFGIQLSRCAPCRQIVAVACSFCISTIGLPLLPVLKCRLLLSTSSENSLFSCSRFISVFCSFMESYFVCREVIIRLLRIIFYSDFSLFFFSTCFACLLSSASFFMMSPGIDLVLPCCSQFCVCAS